MYSKDLFDTLLHSHHVQIVCFSPVSNPLISTNKLLSLDSNRIDLIGLIPSYSSHGPYVSLACIYLYTSIVYIYALLSLYLTATIVPFENDIVDLK